MTEAWLPEEMERIGLTAELQITGRRADGTLRRWVPIWIVCADGQVYVRTWHRRDTGWFGHALPSGRGIERMVGAEAAASTLRLSPVQQAPARSAK